MLRKKEFVYAIGKKHLEILLDELIEIRERISETIKLNRKYISEYNLTGKIILLCSIPGIGFTTAVTILTEIMDINRFKKFDHLASYCGLVPSVRGTGGKEQHLE